MDPQKIIDTLSEIEEAAFYGMNNPQEISFVAWAQLHTDILAALRNYNRNTGLTISQDK